MPTTLPVTDIPRRAEDASDESLDDLSDNDALITQALNPDGTPRRPMNAFMIFARRRRPEITANNPPLRTGEISKVLSSEWSAMTPESKQFYLDRARKLKDNFNARWPDYVYRRRPNNSRKRKRTDGVSIPSAPPLVRRCQSPGREHVVPSSKPKYEDSYHPALPSLPPTMTGAPLTMLYLSEAEQGRPSLLSNFGGTLPSMFAGPYSRPAGTPSLSSSILTSASTSPRSVSSSLHTSYHMPLTNSPPLPSSKMSRVWRESVLSPDPSSTGAFNSPYVGGLNFLPGKTSPGSFDDFASASAPHRPDSDNRHGDWTPPHAVRNSLSLPAFTSNQSYGAYAGALSVDDGTGSVSGGSDFHSYHSGADSHLDYSASSGLVPVHPHFQRS